MLRVVVDTNVMVSATISKSGLPAQVIALARWEKIKLLSSPAILDEFERVLGENLNYRPKRIEEAVSFIKEFATVIEPKQRLNIITTDEPDNRILECAQEGKAHVIVSGDRRHLLPLKEFVGIKIVSPTVFMESIPQQYAY